jgi:hypothetical protein
MVMDHNVNSRYRHLKNNFVGIDAGTEEPMKNYKILYICSNFIIRPLPDTGIKQVNEEEKIRSK